MDSTGWVETWQLFRNYASKLTMVNILHQYMTSHRQLRPLSALNQLCNCYVKTEELDLEDGQWEDVHVITGALKLFFRELPEPLFPYGHFASFITAISKQIQIHLYFINIVYVFSFKEWLLNSLVFCRNSWSRRKTVPYAWTSQITSSSQSWHHGTTFWSFVQVNF